MGESGRVRDKSKKEFWGGDDKQLFSVSGVTTQKRALYENIELVFSILDKFQF